MYFFAKNSKGIEIGEGRFRYALRRTSVWAVPSMVLVFFCFLLGRLELLPLWLYDSARYVMAVIFFVLSIPLGIFLRLDKLPDVLQMNEGIAPVLLSLSLALMNLFLLYLLRSFLETRGEPSLPRKKATAQKAKRTPVEKVSETTDSMN